MKLETQLSGVMRVAQLAGPASGGRSVMFVTPSSVAAVRDAAISFARLGASRAERPAWLIDLDFRGNGLFHHLEAIANSDAERPGRAFSAGLDVAPLYRPAGRRLIETRGGVNPAKLLNLHELPGQNLLVSRFRVEAMAEGQKLALSNSPDWWQAARARASWIIVHALPLHQSGSSLKFCRDIDGVVLVVEADRTPIEDVAAMRDEVEAEGGRVLGAVLVGQRADARLIARFLSLS